MMYRTTLPLVLLLSVLTACGGEDAPSGEPAAENASAVPAEAAPAVAPAATNAGECPWIDAARASELLGANVTVTGPSAGSRRSR